MLLHIPEVLSTAEVADVRAALAGAAWADGRGTAGHLSAEVKDNQQLHWQDPLAARLGALVTARLERNPMFLSAALPRTILPPLFNRYAGGGHYGPHLDGALRPIEGTGQRIRTDLSFTLWLSEPETYDGGALVIRETLGERALRLPAGDLLLYPGTRIHHVAPVTRGERLAAFGWVQSMVRDTGERALLFELDAAIQRLPHDGDEARASILGLTNVYHNLLRRWADP